MSSAASAYGLDHEAFAAALDQLRAWPITRAVCLRLPVLDLHSDPADELIAATSLTHDIALATGDVRIRRSKVLKLA